MSSPPARIFFGMAYDEARQQTVLFGGLSDTGILGDTWIWNGITWTEQHPPTSPSARRGVHLAYDADREQVVMYGGENGSLISDETWLWNGVTWIQATPTTSPPALANASLAFHPTLRRVILHGGGPTNPATWSWNGATWALESVGSTPSSFSEEIMVADATGIVLTDLSATWRLDATWSLIGASSTSGAMGYHAPTGVTRLDSVGGTFTLWANVWTPRPPMQAPGMVADSGSGSGSGSGSSGSGWGSGSSGSAGPRMVYDARRGRTVAVFGETWEWDGIAWRRLSKVSPTCIHAAFDPLRDVTMCVDSSGSVVTWDGEQWRTVVDPGSKPMVRDVLFGASELAFDTPRGIALLVGGYRSSGASTETWQWDGAAWSRGADLPSSRMWHSTASDPIRGRVVAFGGKTGSGSGAPAEETYEWDGTVWSTVPPMTPSPGTRLGSILVYAPNRQAIILFGGGFGDAALNYNDTWRWDGTWKQLEPLVSPPGGLYSAAADITGGVLLLGANGKTWRLDSTTPFSTYESCTIVEDRDGDGLAGCDDPDCWARCTPLCPPMASCTAPDPRCGDGACSRVEDYLICPADCAAP